MRKILIATIAATSAVLISSCATTPEEQKPAPVDQASAKPVAPPKTGAIDVRPQGGTAMSPLKDPNNILSKRSVYFDFDKFDVKAEYKPLVEAHAKYLRDNPGAKMLVQGNADDRGSREYNVGLGQRRSDSVKKMLMLLGAKENQIESVSLGEEKPVCAEHGEDCWAKNRRDDMLYSGEY